MTTIRSIVIVGAGLAGLACALACAQAGAHVQVLDARPQRVSVPAHINVVPNLWRDLVLLGLAERCQQLGFVYNGIDVLDGRGERLMSWPTVGLASADLPPAMGMAHDCLLDVLGEAVESAKVPVFRGHRVVRVAGGVRPFVALADGATFDSDLIVLSTGAHCTLTPMGLTPVETTLTGSCWWHALVPRPQGIDRPTWVVGRQGYRVLIVPVNTVLAGVAILDDKGQAARHQRGPDRLTLQSLLNEYGGDLLQGMATSLDAKTAVCRRTVAHGVLPNPWHRDGVLVIGQRAHLFPPHLGQAAAQAVEDGLVLKQLLLQGIQREALLDRYSDCRSKRVQSVHDVVVRAASWMSSPVAEMDLEKLIRELVHIVSQSPLNSV